MDCPECGRKMVGACSPDDTIKRCPDCEVYKDSEEEGEDEDER